MKITAIIARLVLPGVIAGCSGAPSAPIGRVAPEILNAPNEIVVGDATVRLSIIPWRNFQPSSSPDTRLITIFQITVASGALPSGLRVEKSWLVRENEAWVSVPRQEQPPTGASAEYIARAGPVWPVGTVVTGIVQLRDAASNSYLLRSAALAIQRAD
jgi:hypothetical protein